MGALEKMRMTQTVSDWDSGARLRRMGSKVMTEPACMVRSLQVQGHDDLSLHRFLHLSLEFGLDQAQRATTHHGDRHMF